MGSIFKEQLVKKEPNPKDTAAKVGVVAAAVILIVIVSTLIPSFGVFIAVAIGYGAYWFFQRFNVEYEYIFTDGELDIDKIFNKSRRKRALSVNVKNFDIMAHVDDTMHTHELNKATKILDYSSGATKDNTYAAVFTKDGQLVKLIFEPNETIVDGIHRYIPRQLHKKK